MKSAFLWGVCAVSIFLAGAAQAKQTNGSWEEIPVALAPKKGYKVKVGDEKKVIYPSCALGQPYSFHFKPGKFKPGKRDKLLVYFNGGGACWDSNTCVGSLQVPPPQQPAYVPSTAIQNDPAKMGGILSVNKNNPYANWSMLFISYCTGDVHVGSKVTNYEYPLGSGNMVPIYHRGFDNSLYALNWVKGKINPDKILVAGSSAGSYGAMLNLPWLKSIFKSPKLKEYDPDAKTYGFSDGGMGVFGVGQYVDQDGSVVFRDASNFATAVFGTDSNWNIHENLHPIFASLPSAVLAAHPNYEESFLPEVYNRLSAEYPRDKFAQYTTAYDAIQILFWDIMLNPDTPGVWGAGPLTPSFREDWNDEMNTITGGLRASLPDNYRSYIGPGCNHMILRYDDDFYTSSLTSSTGSEISFLEWLSALTGGERTRTNWQNLSCSPGDCGEATLAADIPDCLTRTFAAP